MKRLIYTLCLIIGCATLSEAKVLTGHKTRLTDNWLYLRGDIGNIWEAVRPAAPGSSECVPLWTPVTLPHCFNATDAVDPDMNYYQGPGWYKTLLDIQNPYPNGRILLDFEGAGQKTEVYIYTTRVASHIGGYDEWTADITEAVQAFVSTPECVQRFGGKVPLSIRCDNSRDAEMIPSDLSDFNVYGGLYRYLNLAYVPEVSIDRVQIDAVLDKNLKKATLAVQAFFYNPSDIRKTTAHIIVKSPSGKIILNEEKEVMPLGKASLLTANIQKPELWSDEDPALYTCEITLHHNEQEQKAIERFGFRHFEFVEKGPFRLNGSRLLLRGTHRHEDHAGVGAAMTEEQMRAEMTLMKEMGVNFIRLGHYQQSDIILSLCDELGILVWEEIPWCRGGLGGEQYQAQAKRMLTNMIHTHYNHPAVIIWGLGNENDWPNDFPEFDKGKIRSFMKELHELAHQSDDSRVTAIRRCDFCKDIVDVYSPSIWAGWYRGIFTDYKNASFHEMQQVKHFFHAEWGGDCHARRHAEDPFINLDKIEAGKGADERAGDASLYGGNARASKDGDWSESYMVRLIDWHLKEQETMDWLTGAAYWPFKDFSTPVRPENPVPYVNQKGVVERDLTPKETYYVFQSYWAKKPMIHIYGHTWPIRWGKPEEMKEILVYSNCPQVELIVNGVPQGIKKRNSQDYPAAGLHWNCKLQAGENTVIALSKGKAVVADTLRFVYETRTWGKPAQLQAKVTHCGGESSGDISMVEVQLTDAKGVPCLDAVNYIEFGLAGDGQLIENQGTSTGSRKVQAYNGRAAIRVDKRKGESVVSVRCDIPEVKTVFVRL
ncbi:glycosyl hydrolases family 2, sugar binding domain protein [Bacteroides fragilis str. 3397 T10]|nr:glycosyl hydrolases family 2, sugar binding domain protein [Bacteroides fragilis str. 3397 T10]